MYEVLVGYDAVFRVFSYCRLYTSRDHRVRKERFFYAEGAWFTDYIWWILERCWNPRPSNRITADAVLLAVVRPHSNHLLMWTVTDPKVVRQTLMYS